MADHKATPLQQQNPTARNMELQEVYTHSDGLLCTELRPSPRGFRRHCAERVQKQQTTQITRMDNERRHTEFVSFM